MLTQEHAQIHNDGIFFVNVITTYVKIMHSNAMYNYTVTLYDILKLVKFHRPKSNETCNSTLIRGVSKKKNSFKFKLAITYCSNLTVLTASNE